MKAKHLIILFAIFAVLLAGVLIKKNQKAPELVTEEYAPLEFSFDESKVARIVIEKASKDAEKKAPVRVEVARQGGRWVVTSLWNARAEEARVRELLSEIRSAAGELRSRDKTLFSDFGIDAAQALHVKLQDDAGKEVLAYALGSKRPDGYSIFIRKENEDAVYLTQANLLGRLGLYGDTEGQEPAAEYWTSRAIASFETQAVEKIKAVRFYGGQAVPAAGVSKTADPADPSKKIWKFESPRTFGLDAEKIIRFLDEFKTWSAEKILDPKARDYGFSKPDWQMTFGLEGGKEIVLTARKDEAAKVVYVQSSADPVIFQLSTYYFENMDADDSRFFTNNPLGVDPAATEKLVIHSDKKELSFKPKEKKTDALNAYLEDLKNFRFERLLSDPKEKKIPKAGGSYWLEIQKQGEASQFLDVGEVLAGTTPQRAVALRGKAEGFSITDAVFKALFENLDRLAEPAAAPAAAPKK